jgi:hypothetical protein
LRFPPSPHSKERAQPTSRYAHHTSAGTGRSVRRFCPWIRSTATGIVRADRNAFAHRLWKSAAQAFRRSTFGLAYPWVMLHWRRYACSARASGPSRPGQAEISQMPRTVAEFLATDPAGSLWPLTALWAPTQRDPALICPNRNLTRCAVNCADRCPELPKFSLARWLVPQCHRGRQPSARTCWCTGHSYVRE